MLFTIYTAVELGEILRKYGLKYHMYADDTQIYICFNTHDTEFAIDELENCIDEIEKWMIVNKLPSERRKKQDFVITVSTSLLKKLNIYTIKVGDSAV